MTPPTADERAAWRGHHTEWHYSGDMDEVMRCQSCRYVWPCPTIRTLDALDAAEALLWATQHQNELAGKDLRTAEAKVKRMKAVLRALNEKSVCPYCGVARWSNSGHTSSCGLAAALADAGGTE